MDMEQDYRFGMMLSVSTSLMCHRKLEPDEAVNLAEQLIETIEGRLGLDT